MKPVGDVAKRVTWRFDDVPRKRPDLDRVTLAHSLVDGWNLRSLDRWRDDAAFVLLLQGQDAVSMVGVMVGDEDVGQFPPARFKRRFNRRCVGRVDCSRGTAFRIMQQDAVVVSSAGKNAGFCRHWFDPLSGSGLSLTVPCG